MKLSHQYFIQSIFWVLLSLVVTQNTWALRCLEGGKPTSSFDISKASNTSHTTSIGNIRVTNTSQAAGTLLWESQTFSTTFTCFDDYSTNSSENAYLYLDDTVKSLDALFKSSNLIIGVRYEGKEYPIGTVERINLAKLALQAQSNSSQAKSNCTLIKKIRIDVLTLKPLLSIIHFISSREEQVKI